MNILRHITIVLSILFILINGVAQEINLSHEIPYHTNDGFALVGEINDTIMLFKEKNSDYSIEIFNQELDFLLEKELFFEKRNVDISGFFTRENDLTIIYSYVSRFKHFNRAVKYDAKGNILDSILLSEQKEIFFDDAFQVVQSKDKNKVLLFREYKYNLLGDTCLV